MDGKNSTDSPVRTRKGSNRLAKWALGSALGLFFVLIVIAVFFQIPSVRTGLKNQLIGQLETYLNARIGIGAITGDFVNGLSLETLKVTTADGDILRLERLSLGYSLPLIFKKNIYIREVRVRGLQVTYITHPDGSANFSNLIKPAADKADPVSSPPSEVQLVIGKLVLENSAFMYRESPGSAGSGQERVQEIKIEKLAAGFSYGEEIKIEIENAAVGMHDPFFPHLTVKGKAVFNPKALRLTLQEVDIRTGDSFLRLAGTLLLDGKGRHLI